MITKEEVKHEIDDVPEYLLEDILKYISNIKNKGKVNRKVHTYKLKGQFDNLDIRAKAYE